MLYELKTRARKSGRRDRAARLFRLLACTVGAAFTRYRQWRKENDAIRHLSEADESLLQDIGLQRWEIVDRVRDRSGESDSAEVPSLCRPAAADDVESDEFSDAA